MSSLFGRDLRGVFGDDGPSGEGAEDNDLIRRVLSRKTVRRYSDRMAPPKILLDLLVASAPERLGKIRFPGRPSILRGARRPPRSAPPSASCFRPCPGSELRPVFFVFPRRCQTAATHLARCAASRSRTEPLEGFFNASIDAALAMQTMILCAKESAGAWRLSDQASSATEVDKVAAILGLPDLVLPRRPGSALGHPQGDGLC